MSTRTDEARAVVDEIFTEVNKRITDRNPYTGDLLLPLARAVELLANECDTLGRVLDSRTEHLV